MKHNFRQEEASKTSDKEIASPHWSDYKLEKSKKSLRDLLSQCIYLSLIKISIPFFSDWLLYKGQKRNNPYNITLLNVMGMNLELTCHPATLFFHHQMVGRTRNLPAHKQTRQFRMLTALYIMFCHRVYCAPIPVPYLWGNSWTKCSGLQ